MSRSTSYALGYAFALCAAAVALLFIASSARAYELEPVLSLTGTCTTDLVDPVPDPGCPGGEHPPSGRFSAPSAVAIDPYGNEYVANPGGNENSWIDVFDDEGFFITELSGVAFPKSIAVDSEGNLYVFLASTGAVLRYAPAAGSEPEKGKIKYEDPPVTISTGIFVGAVTVDAANDEVLVVRAGSITRYKSAAEGNGVVTSIKNASWNWNEAITVDAQRRRLFFPDCGSSTTECVVRVLNADTFAPVETIEGAPEEKFDVFFGQLPIAVDEATGEFCVGNIAKIKTLYCFDEDFNYLSKTTNTAFSSNSSIQIAISNGEPEPGVDANNRHFLFVPVNPSGAAGGNRVLAFQPPDVQPPTIKSVSAEGISETEAELQATIKPNGAATTYAFEYTTEAKFEAEEFNGAIVAGEGTIAGTTFEAEVSALIDGLQPGTAYRFRALAANEASPEGEAGPIPTEKEGSFTTYSDAPGSVGCPNEALRTGPSAALPDCRAYELVTPPNTNGREPLGILSLGDTFTAVQTSPDGNAASFRIEGGALPGLGGNGSFNGDPYLATRTASGWATALAGPTGAEATVTNPGAVSPDQGHSFWLGREEGSKVINAYNGTTYVRYPDGSSELIGRGSLGTDPTAKGRLITEDGTHIVFETRTVFPAEAQQLEPDAPPTGTGAVYDRTADEKTHVVSLLPGDVTPAEVASYVGASQDGEGIAFEIGTTLYLRKGNATTYEIGTGVEFAGVSDGGERVFYVEGGDLLAYDTTAEEAIDFAPGAAEVTPVNVATSGIRAAFVSPSVLGGTNPEGEVAQLGERNLYLSTEGQVEFVATVTDRDVDGEEAEGGNQVDGLGLWTHVSEGQSAPMAETQAAVDPSRLNPSGSVLLFQSRANLTGYDPDDFAQVYRYDSDAGRLHCLSCIPTGVPATGGGALQSYTFNSSLGGAPLSPVTRVPNLTPAGDRVFFESTEALVSADNDNVRDVYEWEEEGVGSCELSGGCTYLISSGRSGRDNFLYGHSRSGEDVFFTTGDVLTGFDGGGTVSIYDARVNGGFAEPAEEECEGEGCRPELAAPPAVPAPESGVRPESGNIPKKAKRCPKGKRKVKKAGKVRCVAKKRHHKKKKAGTSGRAGR